MLLCWFISWQSKCPPTESPLCWYQQPGYFSFLVSLKYFFSAWQKWLITVDLIRAKELTLTSVASVLAQLDDGRQWNIPFTNSTHESCISAKHLKIFIFLNTNSCQNQWDGDLLWIVIIDNYTELSWILTRTRMRAHILKSLH